MARKHSEEEANRHDALTDRADALIAGELLVQDLQKRGKPGWWARRKLRKAASLFEQALAIAPENYATSFFLGKIHQRLSHHRDAFDWFMRAHTLNPAQPDVAREASLEAMNLGLSKEALALCQAAVAAAPEDAGLVSNLALAHLLAGDLGAAGARAREAAQRAPGDDVCQTVVRVIDEVASGRRPSPRTLLDVSALG